MYNVQPPPQHNAPTSRPLNSSACCSTHLHLSPPRPTQKKACGRRLEEVEARGLSGGEEEEGEGSGGTPPEEGEEGEQPGVSAYYHFDSRWVGGCCCRVGRAWGTAEG